MRLQGVPLRVELGMKDVEKQSVMTARRDTGAKDVIPFADVASRMPALLEQIQVPGPYDFSPNYFALESILDGFCAPLGRSVRTIPVAPRYTAHFQAHPGYEEC